MATDSQLQMQKQNEKMIWNPNLRIIIQKSWAPRRNNEYHTPTKSCPGCGATGELFQYRESCPNKYKICYHCGKLGHIQEVCRTIKQPQAPKDDRQRTDPWPSDMKAWSKTYPLPTSEFKGMSQYPYLPIRSLNEPGTPAEQHRKCINHEPCRETEVEAKKKR